MLRKDVIESVRAGCFHIYAVRTVDEGIELLTGKPAGIRANASYPEGTINYLVEQRLQEYARKTREQGARDTDTEEHA
jgi:predicted ATP-dependent protease